MINGKHIPVIVPTWCVNGGQCGELHLEIDDGEQIGTFEILQTGPHELTEGVRGVSLAGNEIILDRATAKDAGLALWILEHAEELKARSS